MTLEVEVERARRRVVTDGYDMSVGELISMYKSGELIIDPEYQRLFRWDEDQRTKFIESLLLGIPTPPIFVSAHKDGRWELVDGLQRVSTILQFVGELKEAGKLKDMLVLGGTELLPNLADVHWSKNDQIDGPLLSEPLKLEFRRQRIRVEILKAGSDADTKYELFQRLNTGGTKLAEQEVRNCILVMIDRPFYIWFAALRDNKDFVNTTAISEAKTESKYDMELVLRYLALRFIKYTPGRDVHDYLDEAARRLPAILANKLSEEAELFEKVFWNWNEILGKTAFRIGNRPGALSLAGFETLSVGTSFLLERSGNRSESVIHASLKKSAQDFWRSAPFKKYSGMGVRGSDRIANLGSNARKFVKLHE